MVEKESFSAHWLGAILAKSRGATPEIGGEYI